MLQRHFRNVRNSRGEQAVGRRDVCWWFSTYTSRVISLLKMPQAGNVHRLAEHKNHKNTDRGAESVRMCWQFGDCALVGSDQYEDSLNMR